LCSKVQIPADILRDVRRAQQLAEVDMLFQNAIADARSELGDTYEGSYSYAAADMMRYAVDGVREAWSMRPSLKYDTSTGALYDPATVLSSTVSVEYYELPLPEEKQHALQYYIIFRCLSRDVTDAGNANAATIAKARFDQIIMG
jgi:hypothetical protein